MRERIRRGDPIPFPVGTLLSAATPLVRLGMWYRLRQDPAHVDARVISFGNITAGGTGKTPAVIARAKKEIEAGRRVGILTRGYGSARRTGTVVSADTETADWLRFLGDEPTLILHAAPETIVFKNPDRVSGARIAIERYGCDVLILDDGYQYTRLARDENVLLIDAANPFGNGSLLPRGILREPLSAMGRATEIVLTRCDQASSLDELVASIRARCPDIPIRKTWHKPTGLRRVRDGEALALSDLQGKDVNAVCAIGHPESFFKSLESIGARVAGRDAFPDHAAIPAELLSAGTVITTEKDAMRIADAPPNVFALCIELVDWAD